MAHQAQQHLRCFRNACPWIKTPLVVNAPMRFLAGAPLAIAVQNAGGFGFIGPRPDVNSLKDSLEQARNHFESASELPIGVGFLVWCTDLDAIAPVLHEYKPAAVWLFAPRDGRRELDSWTRKIRGASPKSLVFEQIGSVREAIEAARSEDAPDVLVVQGSDAGGHGLVRGAGVISLVPEVYDALEAIGKSLPLLAAGGIADGRGASAVLSLGASGVVVGTRFLAATETEIAPGYQKEVLRVTDGGQSTIRTKAYDNLRGTTGWPDHYNGRGIWNKSFTDHESGMPIGENQSLYEKALKIGDDGWGPEGRLTAYAGSAIGLVREVESASAIVGKIRQEAIDASNAALRLL